MQLFGGKLHIQPQSNVGRGYSEITMGSDGWITFVMPHATAQLIQRLRDLLDRLCVAFLVGLLYTVLPL